MIAVIERRWCHAPSCDRPREHVNGVCQMADRHQLRPCDDCGRQCTDTRCSECAARVDLHGVEVW